MAGTATEEFPRLTPRERRERSHSHSGLGLGRISGFEIRLDWSVLFVFALIVFSLGVGLFPRYHPEWSPVLTWSIAFVAATLFLASILAHELAHAFVGRRHGVEIAGITLFIFGGMARVKNEPRSARAEFLMAIAGPLTSLAIGLVATVVGTAMATRESGGAVAAEDVIRRASAASTVLLWLGPLNILLAVFNMLPGFPLDGGRVLRAALWRATGSIETATRWSSFVGRVLALALVFVGVSMIFGFRVPILGSGFIQGMWLMLIGWFLNVAALRGYHQTVLGELFKGVPVARLMRPPIRVPANTPVDEMAERFLTASDHRCLAVTEGDRFAGIVCVSDLRRVPRAEWPRHSAQEVMTPASKLVVAHPGDEVMDTLRKLTASDVDQVPIVVEDRLVGIVRRADVLRWLELNAPSQDVSA